MAKKIDTAGMWTIKGNPITHDGVVLYSGGQIDPNGSLGLDPKKLYPVYRPFDELSKAMESFNGKPLINNHEMIGTAEGLTHPDDKNIGGTIFNVRPSADQEGVIIADMTIFSEEIQELVREGKVELSLGYYCKYRPEVGTHNGVRYEFVQYDLEGNHIALVDRGRMGSGVRVFDAKQMVFDSMEIPEMKDKKTGLDAEELRKEVAGLLKDASDDALAKVKDILAPNKSGDEDDPKKDADKPNDKKGEDDDDPKDKPKKDGEDEGEGDDPKKEKTDDDDDPKKEKTDDDDDPKKGCGGDEDDPKKDADKPDDKKGAGDAAPSMKEIMREFSHREKLVAALKPHIGIFDHDDMTTQEVAKYAAKKLGIATVDGAEVAIVEAHLAALGKTASPKKETAATDADETSVSDGPSAALSKFLGE